MIIQWVTLKVRDFEESKRFYGEYLKLKLENEFSPAPEMKIAFFGAENGVQIELIHDPQASCSNTGVSIGIGTENYDSLLEEARKREILSAEPAVLGGYLECFFVADPNGVQIQIIKKEKK